MKREKSIIHNTIRLVLLSILCVNSLNGQKELEDIFTLHPNKKAVARDSTLYPSRLIIAPVIAYTPETSFGFGVGSKFLFKFKGSGEETRTSNMPVSLKYTLKNQFIFYSGYTVFANQEKWVLFGDVKFQNYPRSFYGIGINTQKSSEETYSYFQLSAQPLLMKRLFAKYFFAGVGMRINHIYNVKTKENGMLETLDPLGYQGNTSRGLVVGGLYDSRNNILNPTQGMYILLTHGFYGRFSPEAYNFKLTNIDLRYYTRVSRKNDDVFACQVLGYFTDGTVPFSDFALLGGPNIMRGYKEGRYVEDNMVATQFEYRKRIKKSRWGVVGFVGFGTVFHLPKEIQLNEIKPSVGIGLRYMIDSKEKLNLRFDWGFGENTNNTYLGIAEAF